MGWLGPVFGLVGKLLDFFKPVMIWLAGRRAGHQERDLANYEGTEREIREALAVQRLIERDLDERRRLRDKHYGTGNKTDN